MFDLLINKLGIPVTKFLLKIYLGEGVSVAVGGIIEIAKDTIKESSARREAQRQFEAISDEVVKRLLPTFEAAKKKKEEGSTYKDLNIGLVADKLGNTLDKITSVDFILKGDLETSKLEASLHSINPLTDDSLSSYERTLYNSAITEAAMYLVEVASSLPNFEREAVAETLKRLSYIRVDLGRILDDVTFIKNRVSSQNTDLISQKYETDYRLATARNLDYLDLFGADLAPESRRYSLSVAYFSLNLRRKQGGPDQFNTVTVNELLNRLSEGTGRILIKGEAGSGKSTLFRWAAIRAATGGKPYGNDSYHTNEFINSGSWVEKIPFLVRLRDCTGGKLPTPDKFPLQIAKELCEAPARWVNSILEDGRGIVFLDGIDEIPNAYRDRLLEDMEAIVNTYPDNLFVISTRPAAVPDGWLAHLGFVEAWVNPMSDPDKFRFINKWHNAVSYELSRQGRTENLQQLATELREKLPRNPQISRLATYPLLCAAICGLHRDRNKQLPETQSELCEDLCKLLLHRRERESDIELGDFPKAYSRLTYEQKRAIVQGIAHYMVRNGESTISEDRAISICTETLDQFPGRLKTDAEVVYKCLIERSGLLRETRPKHIDFIHNTFKEFLAAERFVTAGDIGLLTDRIVDPAWQPVVLFASATRDESFATSLIAKLLIEKKPTQENILMALRCRAASLHLAPKVDRLLAKVAKTIDLPKNMTDAEALADAGDDIVDILRYREMDAKEAAACVRTLRLIGTPIAREHLLGYCSDTRDIVVQELVQSVNPLRLSVIQVSLKEGIPLDEPVRRQISDLSPISEIKEATSKITSLDVSLSALTDIAPIVVLQNLEVLDLSFTHVNDLSPLKELTKLRTLKLRNTQVFDLTPLANLPELTCLDISGTQVKDLLPVVHTKLQNIDISETSIEDLTIIMLMDRLEDLKHHEVDISSIEEIIPVIDARKRIL